MWYTPDIETIHYLAKKGIPEFELYPEINASDFTRVESYISAGKSYLSRGAVPMEKSFVSYNLLQPAERNLKKICELGGKTRSWLVSLSSIADLRDYRYEQEQRELNIRIRKRATQLRIVFKLTYHEIQIALAREFMVTRGLSTIHKWMVSSSLVGESGNSQYEKGLLAMEQRMKERVHRLRSPPKMDFEEVQKFLEWEFGTAPSISSIRQWSKDQES